MLELLADRVERRRRESSSPETHEPGLLILNENGELPDGDLNTALEYYNDILDNSPLEAKTVRSVVKAMRPWLASWLRRDHLSTLMSRGNAPDRERAREALRDSVLGTDQYSEMSNSDVEYAIELLETLG